MILEVGKSCIRRIFKCTLKEVSFVRINNFSYSVKYCALAQNHRRHHCLQLRNILNTTGFQLQFIRKCFDSSEKPEGTLDRLTFESVCSETLISLTEYFEELVESLPHLKSADVTYSDGVLTVNLGKDYGTYVINRQTPNFQIWLSSPTSGPKRYDFVDGTWVYKHDQTTLHSLLDQEIKEIANQEVEFVKNCLYSKSSV